MAMETARCRHSKTNVIDKSIGVVVKSNHLSDDEDNKKKKNGNKKSPFSIENIGWIATAVVVCYYADFLNTLFYDGRIDKSWLCASILCGAVLMFIFSYLIFYLYLFKHMDPEKWDEMYPHAIPCASASAVLFGICLTVSIWPVWGVLSLPMLFIFLMAFISGVCMLDIFKVLCRKHEED